MLPKDKLNVPPSLLVIIPPSLFFFLFQFISEAELRPLAPPRRHWRVFSLSLQWESMKMRLSACWQEQVVYQLGHKNIKKLLKLQTLTAHSFVPVCHVGVTSPHAAPLLGRCRPSALERHHCVWPTYSPDRPLLRCSLLPSVLPPTQYKHEEEIVRYLFLFLTKGILTCYALVCYINILSLVL